MKFSICRHFSCLIIWCHNSGYYSYIRFSNLLFGKILLINKSEDSAIIHKNNFLDSISEDFNVIGEYVNSKTGIDILHNKCGFVFSVQPTAFIKNQICPFCSGRKKNTTIYKREVRSIVGDEYIVLGEYVNNREKVLTRHEKCGYEWGVKPNSFLSGTRCPNCYGKPRKTTESFKAEVKNLVGEEFVVLGEYVNNSTPILIKHVLCGTSYSVIPNSFLGGTRCSLCAGLKPYTTETFNEKVSTLTNGEYVVTGDYKNSKTPITIKHLKCGNEYEVRPNTFLSGYHRCSICVTVASKVDNESPKTKKLGRKSNTEEFKKRMQELSGDIYTVLGEYANSKTDIQMRHNLCGSTFYMSPHLLLAGHGCPVCYKTIPYTTETFKEKVFSLVGDKYRVISEYVKSDVPITMEHIACGNVYDVKPSLFISGRRCPKCSRNLQRSLPEELVAYYVSQYFLIEQNYRPDWLQYPSGVNGEIDIWIPSIKVGIEYDGGIHGSITNHSRDVEKNRMVKNASECKQLIRIREKDTLEFEVNEINEKIAVFNIPNAVYLSSKKTIIEFNRIIKDVLITLGIDNPQVDIDDGIINRCRKKQEDYYIQLGLPIRKRKPTHKKTDEEFRNEVFNLVGNDYVPLDDYVSAIEKIRMKHVRCGYIYSVKPAFFLSGNRCPKCGGTMKLDTDIYKARVIELVGDEYTVLGEYINNREKILTRHEKCGYEWDVKPNSFLNGSRCPNCSGNIKVTTDIFKEKVRAKYGDEFEVISEYEKSDIKIQIRHVKCGHEWSVRPSSFLHRGICPRCKRI